MMLLLNTVKTNILDQFAYRQFDQPEYRGTQIPTTKEDFMEKLNVLLTENEPTLSEGYAPFCKHIFVPNFVENLKVGAVEITNDNQHLLKSEYVARTEQELPVLSRWFPRDDIDIPDATWLDLILYSKDQIDKEAESMNLEPPSEQYDWGIISIKGQNESYELPMNPITMMRNALGKEEGGSGVPLTRENYIESVNFWKSHATVS
eukprot:TRINITY_DN584_c0_g1_i1.p1 TRINITY_DN584_c0_g1~~TRINITY_DN584_c0_g1_i1.p1  ORF type:complete len:205 (-),score=46.90 TRINITY_DN584_c0_g1_i1:1042-1656(-)